MKAFSFDHAADLITELEDNLWEAWSNFGRGVGCRLHDEPDALWYETPLPLLPYNGVLRFNGTGDVDARIAAILEPLRARSVPIHWLVHPSATPVDLPARLEARGLQFIEPFAGMACPLAELPEVPPPPPGIEIREISDEQDVSALCEFAAWRWNIPEEHVAAYCDVVAPFHFGKPGTRSHMWQAWRDGQPVAKAGIYYGENTAGVYAVVTRPEARRLGLARLLCLRGLHAARVAGYDWGVLHSTPMAEGLYQRMGFRTLATFRLYASVAAVI